MSNLNSILHTTRLASSTALLAGIAGIIGWGAFVGYNKFTKLEQDNKIILENIAKVNKKVVLQQVVVEKLKGVPVETAVNVADRIYEQCMLRKIPVSLVCGLIEAESTWDVKATSNVNAKGLMQLMPATARPYLLSDRINYDSNILYDPVVNVTVGINFLSHLQAQFVEMNVAKEGDFTFAINAYFWGPENMAALLGRSNSKVMGPNFGYYRKVMDLAKKYSDLGI